MVQSLLDCAFACGVAHVVGLGEHWARDDDATGCRKASHLLFLRPLAVQLVDLERDCAQLNQVVRFVHLRAQ